MSISLISPKPFPQLHKHNEFLLRLFVILAAFRSFATLVKGRGVVKVAKCIYRDIQNSVYFLVKHSCDCHGVQNVHVVNTWPRLSLSAAVILVKGLSLYLFYKLMLLYIYISNLQIIYIVISSSNQLSTQIFFIYLQKIIY